MNPMTRRGAASFRIASIACSALALGAFGSAGQVRASEPGKRVFSWQFIGRGYLGVEVLPLTPELRAHFGAPEDAGVLVARVTQESPAAVAGIQVGDVLTAVEGKPIAGPPSLAMAVREKKAGENVDIDFLREKTALSATVEVQETDRSVMDLAEFDAAIPDIRAFPGIGPLEGSHGFVFTPNGRMELDPDVMRAFEDAMRDIENRFDSAEWKEKLKRFQELDPNKFQERMKEVEDRLRKLEGELDKEGKKKL